MRKTISVEKSRFYIWTHYNKKGNTLGGHWVLCRGDIHILGGKKEETGKEVDQGRTLEIFQHNIKMGEINSTLGGRERPKGGKKATSRIRLAGEERME